MAGQTFHVDYVARLHAVDEALRQAEATGRFSDVAALRLAQQVLQSVVQELASAGRR